jgi:hypothetical protein
VKIAYVLAAILIAVSPVYAEPKKSPEVECTKFDKVQTQIPKIFPDSKPEADLKGDDLKKFNDAIVAKGGVAPSVDQIDELQLWSNPAFKTFLGVAYLKGCAVGMQAGIPKESLEAVKGAGV